MEKSKFPSETIQLPSQGYFYSSDSSLSSGQVEIKYPTAREEDILLSRNLIQKGIVIDKFLQSIVMSEIDFEELLLGDKNGIMVAARILAYGKDYQTKIRCPRCNTENTNTIDLSLIEAKKLDLESFEKGQNEIPFTLPYSHRDIKIKLLVQKDLTMINTELQQLKKKLNVQNKEVTTRLKYAIAELDGDRDKAKIAKFVDNNLFSQDSLALRKKITEITPDLNMEYDFDCEYCGYGENLPFPMDVTFFWPSR